MKKIFLFLSMLGVLFSACSDYDDSAVWNELNDHASRLAALEKWQETVNGNITALQGVINALQQNDYVTGVTTFDTPSPGGSRITFTKSDEVTIWNGMQGQAGIDGTSPTIAVGQYPKGSGIYYWTIDRQDGKGAQWMEDADGNKLPVTGQDGKDGSDGKDGEDGNDGQDGITPQIRINSQTNQWEISTDNGLTWTDTGVQATGNPGDKGDKGEQGEKGAAGDSIFAADGVEADHPDYVVFTLADGTSFTLPKVQTMIAFESYEVFYGSDSQNELTIVLPENLQETDYTALSATITGSNGISTDIQTRAAGDSDTWSIRLTKPSFTAGTLVPGSATAAIFPPANNKLSETAVLTVTLIDKNGKEHSASRAVKYFNGTIVENTAGSLNGSVDTAVKSLAIKGSVNIDDFDYIVQYLTDIEVLDISMTDIERLPDNALQQATLKRVYLPSTLREIGSYAFNQCTGLEYIDTENVEIIGQRAFQHCSNLRQVRLNNGLKRIENVAFFNCTSLTAVEIPGSVEFLGKWLFEECERLETVILHEGIRELSPSTFYGCGIVSITLPASITKLPDWVFHNCLKLERVNLHDGITSMGKGAFLGCRSLGQIRIPAGVTRIEENTFDQCNSLRFVTFHDGITHLGERAFASCNALNGSGNMYDNELTLPKNLQTMGSSVFMGCTDLFLVVIPTLVDLPDATFFNCTSLVYATLPDHLETVGQWAFGNTAIPEVNLPATTRSIGNNAFHGCHNLKTVVCRAVNAPVVKTDTFDSQYKSQLVLRYPNGSDYSSWSPYFNSTHDVE